MCFVCGRENPIGLHLHFFVDDANRVHAEFTPREEHQGFPGVMHGGLLTTMLDELIGRTAIAIDLWCMTVKLDVRFKKPIPIGEPIKMLGEITKKSSRLLEGRGEIRLADGSLAVEATGTYMKIPDAQMEEYKSALAWWRVE